MFQTGAGEMPCFCRRVLLAPSRMTAHLAAACMQVAADFHDASSGQFCPNLVLRRFQGDVTRLNPASAWNNIHSQVASTVGKKRRNNCRVRASTRACAWMHGG